MPVEVEQIMDRARAIRASIMAAVQGATAAQLDHKPGDRWSAREILLHLGNWEAEAVIWLQHMLRNEPIPQGGSADINQWNAEHLAPYAHLDAAGAIAYIEQSRRDLETTVAQVTEAHLQADKRFIPVIIMTPDHEEGHLHQLLEALAIARGDQHEAAIQYLAYARARILARLRFESRPVSSLFWRPDGKGWSILDLLNHLAIWDRGGAAYFASVADGRPLPDPPYPPGGLDEWNQRQVAQRRHESVAAVLHELGEARGALTAQLRRLTPAQLATEGSQEWLKELRQHDDHHMHQMINLLQGWSQAQS